MNKISVVMGYYNRKNLLIKTLESIQAFTKYENFEVVIVDDASTEDERLEDIVNSYSFDIILHRILPSEKTHINPCVAYNKAFSLATGDVIVIQNPECFHSGDIISQASILIIAILLIKSLQTNLEISTLQKIKDTLFP